MTKLIAHTFAVVTMTCACVLCKILSIQDEENNFLKWEESYLEKKENTEIFYKKKKRKIEKEKKIHIYTSLIPTHNSPVTINTRIAAHGSTTISSPGIC